MSSSEWTYSLKHTGQQKWTQIDKYINDEINQTQVVMDGFNLIMLFIYNLLNDMVSN